MKNEKTERKKEKRKNRKKEYKKELKRFDPILKEIFSEAIGMIYYLAIGRKIGKKVKVISAEISLVKTFRPDILVEADGEIIQVEIQAQQDKTLPPRMFRYYYAILEKYKKEPTQIVLFVGKGNPPPSEYKTPKLTLKYKVLDMKKIDPDVFIKSKKPGEVIVGILAGKFKDKPKIIKKVKKRIVEILKNEEKIIKYIDSISFLAGLFDIEIEVKPMPIQVDIRKTFLYKWGKEEGLKEGEQKGVIKGLKEGEKRGIVKGLKEGEKRGLVKGLKEAILVGIQLRFGDQKAKQIRNFLEKIDDLNHLKKIKREVIRAENWENFVKSIKNSNSKNKI
jgi:predicted transposase YdaD